MPSRVEADLPDPDPFKTVQENQDRVPDSDNTLPDRIGRYRVERVLGKGGFGLVFLAYDEQLDRHVAVKVPHAKLVSRPEDAEAYLTEARTVSSPQCLIAKALTTPLRCRMIRRGSRLADRRSHQILPWVGSFDPVNAEETV